MAPALIETQTKTEATKQNLAEGSFKTVFVGGPKSYNDVGELKGTESQPPASYPAYLPVWDNESSK